MNKILLEIDGKTYPLMGSTLNSYNRNSGLEPYPNDNTFTIQIRMSKLDQQLLDWFYNVDGMKKSGKITLLIDGEAPSYSVNFTEAFSSGYSSNMTTTVDAYGNDLNVTFVAKSINVKLFNQSVSASKPPTV